LQPQRRITRAANIVRLEQQVRDHPEDVDATLTLAEALIQQDERSITGKAGQLFEQALARAPDNPKALWYGAISALSAGQLPAARERLQKILAQGPPDNIRTIIERQIQDIGQQLGEKARVSANNTKAIDVQVDIKPELLKGVDPKTALFILARDPEKGGPPLAVTRRVVGDLPARVTLSDSDAMMPGREISSAPRVEIVARISKSGTPQAQAGDIEGVATVEVPTTKSVTVNILIDRTVTK
jgi:cytochrome c-type biogenesis protein CcmH